MTRLCVLTCSVVIAASACQFAKPADVDEVDAAVDAPVIDGPPGPARLEAPQDLHDFGGVVIGGVSAMFQVSVRNAGDEITGEVGLTLTGADVGEFEIVPTGDSSDCATRTLAGGASCTAQVRYRPTADRSASASLVIGATPGDSVAVPLTGNALTTAQLTSLTSSESFGGVVVGQSSTVHTFTIRNDGEQSTGPLAVTKSGAAQAEFVIVAAASGDCQGATLGQQGTCTIDVRFTPGAAGAMRMATVTATANPGGMHSITLAGDALSPGDLMVELPTGGGPLDFGMRALGSGATSATQTIRIRNGGGAQTGLLAVAVTGGGNPSYTLPLDGCDGNRLNAGASCDVQVRFNPAAIGTQPATITVRDTASGAAQAVGATGVGTGSVTITRTGNGTVTSTPAGLMCGATCASSFATTPVTLTATGDPSWQFETWGGACASSGPSTVCSLPIAAAMTAVSATFRQLFTLTVATTGSGTVTSAPAGINCGADCSEPYAAGTSVQLTAEPDPGWEVFSWAGTGGACAAGQRTCTVAMTVARTVTVEFRRSFTLAVSVAGTGTGTVTGSGINCATGGAGTCSVAVFDGTSVTLTQTAGTTAAGSQIIFGGWSGDCTGTGGCSFTMTANKTVTSTFTLQHRLTLTVASTSGGMGTIAANPGGFTCSTNTCTRFFDAGSNLTVTATPATTLDGLVSVTGDCTSTPCTLASLSAPRTVTATFTHYACVPSSATCAVGLFSQCDATGNFVSHVVPNGSATGTSTTITMNGYMCPLGCHGSGARCNDVDAANGLNAAMDTVAVSPTGIDLILPRSASAPAGKVVLDTSTYDATNGEASITDPDGVVIRVPATVITQVNAPDILVLKVRTFTVRPGRVLEVYGARALAVASHFDVYIGGTLDGSGESLNFAGHAGPGGRNGLSMCSGSFGTGGASGGGGWSSGGMGSGGTLGDRVAHPLCHQWRLRRGYNDGTVGAGGGGIQLASRTRVAIGAAGVVNVSGAGGGVLDFLGYLTTGGGGGGAVLVQTPVLSLTSGAVVAGRGGSGAAANGASSVGAIGIEGPITGSTAAPSVMCTGCLTSGSGGYEGFGSGGSSATGAAPAYGGGGGGCGAFRLMNASGIFTPPAGALKLLVPSGVSALGVR
ncbi:MAG: choice-of-anchor D domain-containing protein [Myxococcales bacterium]|nr:choice-of-anchor D domain-containing protein [Myxococcales bacterium]